MQSITSSYERDLDLNLLRIFAVVAEVGSVTGAAAQLYVTQPAVSAALRRLTTFVRADLFTRQGRGVVLTTRGRELLAAAHAHLGPLVVAAVAPPKFDPKTSTKTVRLGLAESCEGWLLPSLLAVLRQEAPAMQLIVLPVQFRSVEQALLSQAVDIAITVADELPKSILRAPLMKAGFICIYDPRHVRIGKSITEKAYFAHDHVIVSYAGDTRGVVEDVLGKSRSVRLSVPTFAHIADIVEGSPLLGTVPEPLAHYMLQSRPRLRTVALPFRIVESTLELLWPRASDEDDVSRFVRSKIIELSKSAAPRAKRRKRVRAASRNT